MRALHSHGIEVFRRRFFCLNPNAARLVLPLLSRTLGLLKKPPGNFVEKMKQLVDVINRHWFFSPEYTVLGKCVSIFFLIFPLFVFCVSVFVSVYICVILRVGGGG